MSESMQPMKRTIIGQAAFKRKRAIRNRAMMRIAARRTLTEASVMARWMRSARFDRIPI